MGLQNVFEKSEHGRTSKLSNIEKWHLVEQSKYVFTETNYVKLEDFVKEKKCVILKGLIGTGKSELALQYCYRNRSPSTIAYKLQCTNTNMFEKSLRDLYKCLLNIDIIVEDDSQKETLNKIEDAIIREMNDKEGYLLLLLDDVTQISKHAVNDFLKKCKGVGNIKLIVTTSVSLELDAFTKVVEVSGFSENEAGDFLANGCSVKSVEKSNYIRLARLFSCNPKGLHIAKAYMKETGHSTEDLTNMLNFPLKMYELEKTIAVMESIEDKTLFVSLVSLIGNIHKKYQEKGKDNIFEMLLLLQFLEAENIPVVLFTKLSKATKFYIGDLIYEIKNSSFGTFDEHVRTINTHDLVKSALQIYMKVNEANITLKSEQLLKNLLRAFFLLMDKDNRNQADLKHHISLIPHARTVLEKLKAVVGGKFKGSSFSHVEYLIQVIYLKDIIGYTYSFNEMFSEANEFYEDAKKYLFELLNVAETFPMELEKLIEVDCDICTLKNSVFEKTKELYTATVNFISNAKQLSSVKQVSKDYVLNKYRNAQDVGVLSKSLGKPKLSENSHLTESEYFELSKKGLAISFEFLSEEFVFELVISVLHTYGRRLFYLTDDSDTHTAKLYFSHLCVARKLSEIKYLKEKDNGKECLKLNRLSFMLTERSEIQSVIDFPCTQNEVDSSTLNDYISVCESRLNESVDYLEFGVLKDFQSHNKNNHFTAIWVKLIIGCYRRLIEIKKTSKLCEEASKWARHLSEIITSMKDSTCYPNYLCSLGDLYFATGDLKESEKLFEELLPKIEHVEDKSKIDRNLKWFERKACVCFVRCRINRSDDTVPNFDEDTLDRLEDLKSVMQKYKKEMQDLEKMKLTLTEKLSAHVNTNNYPVLN